MRVLLIGGNGFIGSPLTRELVAAGHQVAILHRGTAKNLQPDVVHHAIGQTCAWQAGHTSEIKISWQQFDYEAENRVLERLV